MMKVFKVHLALIWLLPAGLWARPFVKIDRVDIRSFPLVQIDISLRNIYRQPFDGFDPVEHLWIEENRWRVSYFKAREIAPKRQAIAAALVVQNTALPAKAIEEMIGDALYLIDTLTDEDKASLFTVNDRIFLLSHFSDRRYLLKEKIQRIRFRGKDSQIYDGIEKAMRLLQSEGVLAKKVLVFFGEGYDTFSSLMPNDLIEKAVSDDIALFAFLYPSDKKKKSEQWKEIERIAYKTGGDVAIDQKIRRWKRYSYRLRSQMVQNIRLEYRSLLKNESFFQPKTLPLQIDVFFHYKSIADSDRFIGSVHLPPAYRSIWKDRMLLFVVFLSLFVFLVLLAIFLLLRKERVDIHIDEAKEDAIKKALEARAEEKIKPLIEQSQKEPTIVLDETKTVSGFVQIKEGPQAGKRFLLYWDRAMVGRDPANTIVLNDPAVNKVHAKIEKVKGRFYLFDLISDTGVFLNGKKLLRPKELKDFDEIRVGNTVLIFRKINLKVQNHYRDAGRYSGETYPTIETRYYS